MNCAGDLQRWEEQLYALNPELHNESIENKEKIHIKLKKQLQQKTVKVILQKLSSQIKGNGAQEASTEKSDDNIKFEKNINDTQSTEDINLQLDFNNSLDKMQPQIPMTSRKRRSSKVQQNTTIQKQSTHSDSNVPRYSTDCESNLSLENSAQKSLNSYEFRARKESQFQEYSLESRTHSRVSSTSTDVFDSRVTGMSLQVKPRSENSPLTVTLHVPTLQHVFEKEIKFDILMEPPDLIKHLADTKLTHVTSVTENFKKIKNRRQSTKVGDRQNQRKSMLITNTPPRKLTTVQQDDETFSRLLSEVLIEPGEALESWQAANALCNINNNVIDNYNANLEEPDATTATAVVVCNRVDSGRTKKYRKTETCNREPKARRGRKPKPKSDLAKYVEEFTDSCAPAGSRTPATSSNISQPLVTSTTQNGDDTTTPVTYFFESQTGQLLPVSSLSTTATQLISDEVNTNGPFDEIVNYIDNTNADVDSNVIARVLEDGGGLVGNANVLHNFLNCPPSRRATISLDFPILTRSLELKPVEKSSQRILSQPISTSIEAPRTAHTHFTMDDYDVIDLSTTSKECHIIDESNDDEIDDFSKPLDLSKKQSDESTNEYNLDVSTNTETVKIPDQSLEGEMEATNFKAGLDMPLLDATADAMALEILGETVGHTEKDSNISNVADFEYMANNLSDEHMKEATDAAAKDTTELLSQFAFSDHSSKALFETLLNISTEPIVDNDKTDSILNLIQCENGNETTNQSLNSSIDMSDKNHVLKINETNSSELMFDNGKNVVDHNNDKVKNESEIICKDIQTGNILNDQLENETFESNEVSIKANDSVESQKEETTEKSKNDSVVTNEYWMCVANLNKGESAVNSTNKEDITFGMQKQEPKSPNMENQTGMDSVQDEALADVKTCINKSDNTNLSSTYITASKLFKEDEISPLALEQRETKISTNNSPISNNGHDAKTNMIALNFDSEHNCNNALDDCSLNENINLFEDCNATSQNSMDNSGTNTNEILIYKESSNASVYDASNKIDLQMEKTCDTGNDEQGEKARDKTTMSCPLPSSALSILELESKLNEDILDFDDDALSLATSSIDSQDECNVQNSSISESVDASLEIPLNTGTVDALAETSSNASQTIPKRFRIPKLKISRDFLNNTSMTVEASGAKEADNDIVALPVWSELPFQEIFGVTCWAHLVGMCPNSAGECCDSHSLRDPEMVRKELENLSQPQLNATYKYVHAHLLLYRHYFDAYCKIFTGRKDRDRLLKSVTDCELYVECATHLHNVYRGLVQCGFSKVNACRRILSRVRSRALPFVDVLVEIIMDVDWTLFCEHLERFAAELNYNYSPAQLRTMTVAVLNTKDARLAKVLCTCLTTIRLNEIELVRNAPEIEACLELMTTSNIG